MTNIHAVDREEVMAFLDGELDATRTSEVEEHLRTCADCRLLADDIREVAGRLKTWPVEPAPAGLATFDRSRLSWFRARTWLGVPRWAVVALPVAAVLALMVVQPFPRLYRAKDAVGSFEGAGSGPERPILAPSATRAPSAPQGQLGQQQRGFSSSVPDASTGPMIARSVALSIVTEQFSDARAALERITADLRGMVSSLQLTGDPPARRSLRATVRVPAERLDAALAEVRKLGNVRQESQSSEDVSSAHRDLVVRIDNAVKEEARLNDLLVNRTGRLQDVLAVEQEVTRVRGQIEQMKAEEIAMRTRVAYATIAVDISEAYKAEVGLAADPLPIGVRLRNALVEGWRAAADTAFGLVLFMLQAGPSMLLWMLVLGPPAWWVWRRTRRAV